MAEFLDFNEISQRIPFANVLDFLNIPYTVKGKELRGEGFIVDTGKNLYFNPKGDDKGSVINFLHAWKGGTLRDCAIELKKQFLDEPKKPEREIPTLELDHVRILKFSVTPFRNYPAPDSGVIRHPIPEISGTF